MSESKLGQGYYYIVVIHLTNSLKGNLDQVNEFPRDVSDIDWISKASKETMYRYKQYHLHAKSCLIQKLSFKNRNNVHTSPLHRRESK